MKIFSTSPSLKGLACCPRTLLILACVAFLGGCKTFSPNGGMGPVAEFVGINLNKDVGTIRTPEDEIRVRQAVSGLLQKPLTPDTAVQIALLNNRGLQAAYNELGIAEAVFVASSRPPPPSISLSSVNTSIELDIERQVVANILALLTQPARTRIATNRFEQAELQATLETLRIAAETRRAYYRAVAARESVAALTQAKTNAENAAELAKKLGETGAQNKLDQAQQEVFYADVTTQLAAARLEANSERERLVRSMGLWGYDLDFKLPDALPALPPKPQTLPTIEQDAMAHRVDLQIARLEVEALARSYGLTRATHFINALDATGISKTQKEHDSGRPHSDGGGYEVRFEIPIFDFGRPRVVEAEQFYMQAVNLLAEQAINARSQAREAYRTYRAAYDIALHYKREVLPLRQAINEQLTLQQNAMLIDVFKLVTQAQLRITATVNGIEAKRNFWLAHTDVEVAVLGGGSVGTGSSALITTASTTPGK
jgi:outer membrane protein TolC